MGGRAAMVAAGGVLNVRRFGDLLPQPSEVVSAPARARRAIVQRPLPTAAHDLHGLDPLLQRLYLARSVSSTEQLRLQADRLLRVGSLESVQAAAELLTAYRDRPVLVIGDFDADGATSTALMLHALRAFGFAQADFLVPDRFKYGYGLTPGIVQAAADHGAQLIVTVDNGTSSVAGVALARSLGLAVLVTDHHLPGTELPQADVIVNPNLPGSAFGSRALAGVGVAFYVLAALRRHLDSQGLLPAGAPPVQQWLDLVALGTVADLVSLDDNNRVLVAEGLRRIRAGRCVPGILALLQAAKREPDNISAADLGFLVAPRLNAAGRLDDMSIGIECLLAPTLQIAQPLAQQLDEFNRQRRQIEAEMQTLALAAVRGMDLPQRGPRRSGLCIYDAAWHQGVVGLVASRIKDRVRRPVIAFADASEVGWLRGSARSVAGVHIRDVIDAVATRHPGLVGVFGGHAMAAGLSLPLAHLDRFSAAFDAEVAEWLQRCEPDESLLTDGPLDLAQLSLTTAQMLRAAGPWGQGFPEPSFNGLFQIVQARVVGDRHAKLRVQPQGLQATFDAIAFGYLDEETTVLPQGLVELVYRLDINVYQAQQRLQLLVEHLQSP